ncbi:Surfactin synthase thioesterase subunit [Thermomonospora echinospora]|uniref:Surfactin synthase thioesterase subunit n=1 Tax=Thermomonospora echinospora TaxID=1992 RepID=A0A1H5VFW4_9ACTN|nr:alpha/beta fold hydrolase [Thermomonospora echinospora]SEF86104.1 Surfactin synthase thioesterase subunit [Thermomonospora echinospora]
MNAVETLSGVIRPRPIDGPEVRLFLLHHAGGSHTAFRRWVRHLPAGYEACLIETPGRGRLAGVPAKRRMADLVGHLLADVDPWLDRPFAVFGHSMGGLVGYELVRALHARGGPLPVWLGVSGHPYDRSPEYERTYLLPDERFRELMGALGGVPRQILDEPRYWRLFEPLMRADLELCQTWEPDPAAAPLPVPMTAFAGLSDAVAGPARIAGWAARSSRFLGVRYFEGGHFHLRERPVPVIGGIVADVAAQLPGHVREPRANGERT